MKAAIKQNQKIKIKNYEKKKTLTKRRCYLRCAVARVDGQHRTTQPHGRISLIHIVECGGELLITRTSKDWRHEQTNCETRTKRNPLTEIEVVGFSFLFRMCAVQHAEPYWAQLWTFQHICTCTCHVSALSLHAYPIQTAIWVAAPACGTMQARNKKEREKKINDDLNSVNSETNQGIVRKRSLRIFDQWNTHTQI